MVPGSILIFSIGGGLHIFGVGYRETVSPDLPMKLRNEKRPV